MEDTFASDISGSNVSTGLTSIGMFLRGGAEDNKVGGMMAADLQGLLHDSEQLGLSLALSQGLQTICLFGLLANYWKNLVLI